MCVTVQTQAVGVTPGPIGLKRKAGSCCLDSRVWSGCGSRYLERCAISTTRRSSRSIASSLRGGVSISQRNVTYLLDCYDELVALRLSEAPERRERLQAPGRRILAIDGLQPDVGHEVRWVVRDGSVWREMLLARSLLSSAESELTPLLREAVAGLEGPVVGAVSDGQHAVRNAVAEVFPGLPHQLCHFHYLRQAAGPIWEADRHAKKELKKRVRSGRWRGARTRKPRSCKAIVRRCASRASVMMAERSFRRAGSSLRGAS
jgi:hypothetical protein